MAKVKLSQKRDKWIKQFKPEMIKGQTLQYNASVQKRYEAELKKLVVKMTKYTQKEIEALYNTSHGKDFFAEDASLISQARILLNKLSKKFDDMFSRLSGDLAYNMVSQTDRVSNSNLKASLGEMAGLAIKTNIKGGAIDDMKKALITSNVDLIKSIPSEYLTKIKGSVFRSITSGQGLKDLVPQIQKYGDMTETRAKTIALDQTRKAYNTINAEKMKKVGVQKFEWIHSGGSRFPREDHIAMDGNIYSFDDLPVIDQNTGERGLPGQAINCRCTMKPVIVFDES